MTTPDEGRAQLQGASRVLKAVLEEGIDEGGEPDRVNGQFQPRREGRAEPPASGAPCHQGRNRFEPERFSAVANLLVTTFNRARVMAKPRGYRKYDAGFCICAFNERIRLKYGGLVPVDHLAENDRDVLRGLSLDRTFGGVSDIRKKVVFDPSRLHTGRAERPGGRVIPARTAEAGAGFMLERLGMRGVQFGNSMTDREWGRHPELACEAFADLAVMLGLADEDISLGGRLAFSFGARGHGTSLAYNEPTLWVIKPTWEKGVGSRVLEWAPAFDNRLGTGGSDTFMCRLVGQGRSFILGVRGEQARCSRVMIGLQSSLRTILHRPA